MFYFNFQHFQSKTFLNLTFISRDFIRLVACIVIGNPEITSSWSLMSNVCSNSVLFYFVNTTA